MKRLVAILAAVLFIPAGMLAAAPTASAHEVCGGSLIDTYNVRTSGAGTGGTHYATIRLYYSSVDGGTNCASLEKVLWHGEKRNDMFLGIGLCSSHNCAFPGFSQSDHSLTKTPKGYLYYAGPVKAKGAANKCVYLNAHMYSNADDTGTQARRIVAGVHGPGCPND